jgi:hypothetical protein
MEYGKALNSILKECCWQFKNHDLPFCLAGGWAVSMLGITRTTIDIDLLVILDEAIKKKIIDILESAFFLIQSHEHEMEFKHIRIWRNIVSLKEKTEPFVIDLMSAESDYLKSVIARSVEIEYEAVMIPVISIEDLIVLKMFSFRKQDQVDIENLLHAGTPINWEYLQKTIELSHLDWDYLEQIKSHLPV